MGNKIEQFRRLHTTPIKRIEIYLNYIDELNLKYNYQMFTFDNQFLPMMDFDKVNALMPSLGGSIIKQPDNHNRSIYSKYTISARNAYFRLVLLSRITIQVSNGSDRARTFGSNL